MSMRDIKRQYPNFTIICDKCKSKEVVIRNSLGWSEESGVWGSVSLYCNKCENFTKIADAH